MDSEKVFHMTGGVGETSYAKNSLIQKKASDTAKNITLQTIQQVYNLNTTTPKSFGIADLGCGSGHNTLSIIKQMLEACTYDEYDENFNTEFRVYLNDLPNNDFNAIFKAFPDFYTELRRDGKGKFDHLYIGAYPGSFYGRLFPEKCLHFIYSNNSLHWLSKGLVEGEKLDGYDVQFYAPSEDEIKDEVIREGSFQMDRFEMFEIDKVVDGGASYGAAVAKTVKAVQGPMICQHFGDGVLDIVFENYARLVDEEMAIEEIRPIYFVFVLRKL